MAKKRTSLDSLFATTDTTVEEMPTEALEKEPKIPTETIKTSKTKKPNSSPSAAPVKFKGEVIKQTVYLPPAVHEQLRQLAFEERKKMHDYLVEGLDRVFKNRGLKPYIELSDATKQ